MHRYRLEKKYLNEDTHGRHNIFQVHKLEDAQGNDVKDRLGNDIKFSSNSALLKRIAEKFDIDENDIEIND